ncbi:hypothetical protein NUSPORA_01431 [Nucleospora cyclopteri]
MIFVFIFYIIIKSAESNKFIQLEQQEFSEDENLSENFLQYKIICNSIETHIEKIYEEIINDLLENVEKQIHTRRIFINAIEESEKLSKIQAKNIIQELKDGDPNFESVKTCILNQLKKEKEKIKQGVLSAIYDMHDKIDIKKKKIFKELNAFTIWFNNKKEELQEKYKLKNSECVPNLKKSKNSKQKSLKKSMKELSLNDQKSKKTKQNPIKSSPNDIFSESLGLKIEETEVNKSTTSKPLNHSSKHVGKKKLPKESKEKIFKEVKVLKTEKTEFSNQKPSINSLGNKDVNPIIIKDNVTMDALKNLKLNKDMHTNFVSDIFFNLCKNIKSEYNKTKILESLSKHQMLCTKDLLILIKDNNIDLELQLEKQTKFVQQILIKTVPDSNVKTHTMMFSDWKKVDSYIDRNARNTTYTFEFTHINNDEKETQIIHLVSKHLTFDKKSGNVNLGYLTIDNKFINETPFNLNDDKTFLYITNPKWLTEQKISKEECEISGLNILHYISHIASHFETIHILPIKSMFGTNHTETICFVKEQEQLTYLPYFSLILTNKKIEQLRCLNIYEI